MGTDWLARIVVSTVVRRVVGLLLVIVLAWAGIGRAEAANPDTSQCFVNSASDSWCATEAEAYQALSSAIDSAIGSFPAGAQVCGPDKTGPYNGGAYDPSFRITTRIIPASGACSDGGGFTSRTRRWPETGSCPEGTNYNPITGSCMDQTDCMERNQLPGFKNVGPSSRTFKSRCIDGCTFEAVGPNTTSLGITSGVFEWTGVCSIPPVDPGPDTPQEAAETNPQECAPVGNLTQCLKPNGDHCISASNGKQFCWKPGEVGEKTDGPDMQDRDPGDTAIPPNMNLPSGDTLIPGDTATTTTTQTDAAGNVTTITTTVTNYTTQNGTNAGSKDQGEPSDGTGNPDGEGDEDGDGTAAGGQNCDTPLVVSGGDPVLAEVAKQQYMTRCGDGTDPNPNPSEYLGDGTGEPDGEGRVFGGDISFDMSGFGYGGSCPTIPAVNVMGTTIEFDTSVFCDWMHLGGWFVLLLTSIFCGTVILRA